jgi:acyl carrier protein
LQRELQSFDQNKNFKDYVLMEKSMTAEEKVKEIFAVVLDLPDSADVTKVRMVNTSEWNSLAQASIIAAIESEFGLELDPQDYERITSFESALLLVEEKVK